MSVSTADGTSVPASVRAKLVELSAERSLLIAERERLTGQVRAADAAARESRRPRRGSSWTRCGRRAGWSSSAVR